MSAKFPRGGGGAGPFLVRSLLALSGNNSYLKKNAEEAIFDLQFDKVRNVSEYTYPITEISFQAIDQGPELQCLFSVKEDLS